MNYLKSLIEPLFNSKLGVQFRNKVGFKPVSFAMPRGVSNLSASDLFIWRFDENFKTVFRFSDIPSAYYQIENSDVLIVVYDNFGRELYRQIISPESSVAEFEIVSEKIGQSSTFGTFSIFHLCDVGEMENVKITNRCYVGYQYKNAMPSFVHGNFLAQYINLSSERLDKAEDIKVHCDIAQSWHKKSQYIIQKSFQQFDFSELAFVNPTEENLEIDIDNERFEIPPRGMQVFRVKSTDIITISSHFSMPRPVVFSYKGGFIDCHHA